ncbi:NAD-dependent succinate-semialdehyde dehydrogenase [Microvenator marinus]|uniref:NAD-dependent succinate-semialdehyde dehydrogenase n=1 Tax=Microvenator marinus TaxID=2600177 RepID=A0A5B8XQF8_9DELT|nr:NAD-dependent succinate-semialdehyde dehydrogenase [Microvenator marinus]QED27755.1 NAD-dependent succinate-semialdehyde dehydrogenase [Microvenator marinus]
MKSINPATQTLIREYPDHNSEDVEEMLERSSRAFRDFSKTSFDQRADMLNQAAAVLREKKEQWARLMTEEMGKPIKEARAEVEKCAWVCEHYAETGAQGLKPKKIETDATNSWVQFQPLGTVLAVMPWNFPFWQVFRFAAPTLMAGNTALLKHAGNVSGCALAIEEIFAQAQVPDGVFQTLLIDHDLAEKVIKDRRVHAVSLTGSTRAGRAVASVAGQALKPTLLELGGSDPFIVLADANLEKAAKEATRARCLNSGQSCIAAKRFIVVDEVHDEFIHLFRKEMRALKIGDPTDESIDIGPQARVDLAEALHEQVKASIAAGAVALMGGEPSGLGPAFYPPTIISRVDPGMSVFDEETFGPVAAVIRAKNTDHAIKLANQTEYGLGASLWTTSDTIQPLVDAIDSGHVAINGIVKSDPRLPFGGIKDSGYGRELGEMGLHAFVNAKTVADFS